MLASPLKEWRPVLGWLSTITTATRSFHRIWLMGVSSKSSVSTMDRFSARHMGPSCVICTGMPTHDSMRCARPTMLPRLSGSGWTWETRTAPRNASRPARKRSERREIVEDLHWPLVSPLSRDINVNTLGPRPPILLSLGYKRPCSHEGLSDCSHPGQNRRYSYSCRIPWELVL